MAPSQDNKFLSSIRTIVGDVQLIFDGHTIRDAFARLSLRQGLILGFCVALTNTDVIEIAQSIEQNILRGNDENALRMKKSLEDDCSNIAVAAAIFAQVAITALSLTDVNAVNWTVKACFIVSFVYGALSVFFGCLIRQRISNLFRAEEVKDWLSLPASREDFHVQGNLEIIERLLQDRRHAVTISDNPVAEEAFISAKKEIKKVLESTRWSRASLNRILLIKIPTQLLKMSVGSLIIGLGIYLGCVWKDELNSPLSKASSHKILIVFIVVTAHIVLHYILFSGLRDLEYSWLRNLDRKFHFSADRSTPTDQHVRLKSFTFTQDTKANMSGASNDRKASQISPRAVRRLGTFQDVVDEEPEHDGRRSVSQSSAHLNMDNLIIAV